LESVAQEPAAQVQCRRFDPGQDLPIGRGVGHPPQLADHRQGLLERGGFQVILGVKRAAGHREPPGGEIARLSHITQSDRKQLPHP
jgi:hypothetical protein